jgi:lysophospholipase L1-like esterase
VNESRSNPSLQKLQAAYRSIAVLLGLVVGMAIAIAWMWQTLNSAPSHARPAFLGPAASENLVRKLYPAVDFQPIYPDMSTADIDQLQRECSGIRYSYEPYVQFLPSPMRKRFITIGDHGIRQGPSPAPWPPDPAAVNIFVFGGSTTLGYHLRNDQTLPACLERRFREQFSTTNLWCYNFGSGYHFSSQERTRFAGLLADNIAPDAAIFIDGLNDFYHPHGQPQFTSDFHRLAAPDLTIPNRFLMPNQAQMGDNQRQKLIDTVLARLHRNIQLTAALATRAGVAAVFVGQPVPFHGFQINDTYPFEAGENPEDRACRQGYPQLQQRAEAGAFGGRFVWAGDAFLKARNPMYADKVHYSPDGADLLAATIIRRSIELGLLSGIEGLGKPSAP